MSIRRFTSESYPEAERAAAWQDLLGAIGLVTTVAADDPGAPTAGMLRSTRDGVTVASLVAGRQTLSAPIPGDIPLLIVPLADGATLEAGGTRQRVVAGDLVLLRRGVDDRIAFVPDLRVVVLAATEASFRGRRIGLLDRGEARTVRAEGLASVLARSLVATAEALEELNQGAWHAVDASLAELLLALLRQMPAGRSEAGSSPATTAAQAALLHRIGQFVERRLSDPHLSPARAAQAEGISERYLQRLFETAGDSFTHFLRERRLQRSRIDLASPAEAQQTVSEIAYRCGFTDAAHFSRAFRERFGLSPRAFRQQEAERTKVPPATHKQRGRPQHSPLQARARRAEPRPDPAASGADVTRPDSPRHHCLTVDADHVHWGYFSRSLKPVLEIASGDTVTIETLTQHASDDPALMIAGDPGAESVFGWTAEAKAIDRRGAGPMDASIYGRGAGEGFGVHICTGPIAVKDAQPGDVLEVRIVDIVPRPSRGTGVAGRVFGSSAAAWWGYHYAELLSEPNPREVVTIYEIETQGESPHARALYSYRWTPQRDPFGVLHRTYDYPGVPVLPDSIARRHGILDGIRIPLRPHFGVVGVAPREADLVDSVPPSYFGGNVDNWRLGKGAAIYLPVSVPGALLSLGDPHAAQGDGELSGTAIECSMTGTISVVLHRRSDLGNHPFADLTYPLIETETDWVLTGFSHPNYLAEFGAKGQSEVYATSSIDLAMKDAFRKARRFLMQVRGLDEDEAVALISAAIDFGVTQVVDGNWGVHAIVSKRLCTPAGIEPDPNED